MSAKVSILVALLHVITLIKILMSAWIERMIVNRYALICQAPLLALAKKDFPLIRMKLTALTMMNVH